MTHQNMSEHARWLVSEMAPDRSQAKTIEEILDALGIQDKDERKKYEKAIRNQHNQGRIAGFFSKETGRNGRHCLRVRYYHDPSAKPVKKMVYTKKPGARKGAKTTNRKKQETEPVSPVSIDEVIGNVVRDAIKTQLISIEERLSRLEKAQPLPKGRKTVSLIGIVPSVRRRMSEEYSRSIQVLNGKMNKQPDVVLINAAGLSKRGLSMNIEKWSQSGAQVKVMHAGNIQAVRGVLASVASGEVM